MLYSFINILKINIKSNWTLVCLLIASTLAAQGQEIIDQRCFGGNSVDALSFTTALRGGGYLAIGHSGSLDGTFAAVPNSPTDIEGDVLVVRFDDDFNIVWARRYGGPGGEGAYYNSKIFETSAGDFIITLQAYMNGGDITNCQGNNDLWVLKIRPDNSIIYSQCFGGNDIDIPGGACLTNDGGLLISMRAIGNQGTFLGQPFYGSTEARFIRIDSMGQIMWQKMFGGSGEDDGKDIVALKDGTFIVVVETASNDHDLAGAGDVSLAHPIVLLLHLDSAGNVIKKHFLDPGDHGIYDHLVKINENRFLILASTSSRKYTKKNHKNVGNALLIIDTTFTILKSESITSNTYAPYSLKYNATGTGCILTKLDGSIYIAFSAGIRDVSVNNYIGLSDLFVIKLNGDLGIEWSRNYGTTNNDVSPYLCFHGDTLILTGCVGLTSPSDGDVVGCHVTEFGSGGPLDYSMYFNDYAVNTWVCMISDKPLGYYPNEPNSVNIVIYPNPTNGELIIVNNEEYEVRMLTIDGRGARVLEGKVSPKGTTKFTIEQQPSAMYIVSFFDTEGKLLKTEKIIKE